MMLNRTAILAICMDHHVVHSHVLEHNLTLVITIAHPSYRDNIYCLGTIRS